MDMVNYSTFAVELNLCSGLQVLSLLRSCLESSRVGKNPKIYSLLVYHVNFIFYCSALTLLTVGTISVYSVIQIEQQELKKKKGGKGKCTLLHIR